MKRDLYIYNMRFYPVSYHHIISVVRYPFDIPLITHIHIHTNGFFEIMGSTHVTYKYIVSEKWIQNFLLFRHISTTHHNIQIYTKPENHFKTHNECFLSLDPCYYFKICTIRFVPLHIPHDV